MTIEPARRIGITGGGGFIGSALARTLRAQGHEVRCVDVTDAGGEALAEVGAELVLADVTDADALRDALAGLDAVVHTAAVVAESGDWDVFRAVNVDGARNAATAARAGGARRFLHVSSVMVHGFDFPEGVDEDRHLDGADNPYCTTKIESEAAVLASHEPGAFDVSILRPGDVYGPGSVPWTIRPVTMMRDGLWARIEPDAAIQNHVYVDNLVDGLLLVLERGAPGEAYAVTDDVRTTTGAFFGRYEAMLGLEAPTITADEALALGVDPEAVRYMTRRARYSCDKVKALGYRPAVGLDEGMARTREWLVDQGLVPNVPPAD